MARTDLDAFRIRGIAIEDDLPQNGEVLQYNAATNEWEYATGGGGTGTVETIVAGTGISVDSTDPANPIVSATGGGGGTVDTISSTDSHILVDSTDPANPTLTWQLVDNENLLTDDELAVVQSTSGTNTGDQVADGVTITGVGSVADPFVAKLSDLSIYGKNETGAIILKGTLVSIISASGQWTAFGTTDITTPAAYAYVGLAMTDIAINAYGYVLKNGTLTGLNTSALDEGKPVYVSTTGGLTKTFPTVPNYIINVGMCEYKHVSQGRISIIPNIVSRLQDLSDVNGTPLSVTGQIPVWDNTGKYFDFAENIENYALTSYVDTQDKVFPVDVNRYGFLNRTQTTLSFDGVKTFTLGAASTWSYYRAGLKHTITGGKTVDIVPTGSPVDGTLYYIYIDSTTGAVVSGSAWTLNDTKVPVCTIYFDSTMTPNYVMADERHTCQIDRAYHREHHFTEGTTISLPGTITGLTAGSDTPANKTFGISGTRFCDEDLWFNPSAFTDPDGATPAYYNLYRTAASTYKWELSDMPFKYTTSAGPTYGYIEYDLNGTSTQSAANRFVNTYVFFSNSVANAEADPEITTSPTRMFIMQGRGSYTTSALAIAERFQASPGMVVAEGVAVYQLTWSTTNRPNSVKGRCQFLSAQQVFGNTISTSISATTAHNSLTGIDGGQTDEYYHMTLAQHTIATQPADTTNSGYLTTTDWDTFNGKQDALGYTPANKAGDTFTGAIVTADHGTATNAEVVGICYGTSSTPPTANTTPIGTIYLQYTA